MVAVTVVPTEAKGQREIAMMAADTRRLRYRVGQEVARGAGSRRLDGVQEQLTKSRGAGRHREADHDDEPLYEHERYRECKAAGMCRPVSSAKPHDRILQQLHPTGGQKRLAGVVPRQLPGFLDE